MRKSNFVISSAIIGVLVVGGIAAYFTGADSVTNRLFVPDLHILLFEPSWNQNLAYEIVPNEKIAKDPYIKNNSKTDAYVFLQLTVPYADDIILEGNGTDMYKSYTIDENGELVNGKNTNNGAEVANQDYLTGAKTNHFDAVELFRFFQLNDTEGFNTDDWTQIGDVSVDTEEKTITYVFGYGTSQTLKILKEGENTPKLFNYVKFVNIQEGQGFEPITNNSVKDYHIILDAYGIQCDYLGLEEEDKTNPEKVWKTYCSITDSST